MPNPIYRVRWVLTGVAGAGPCYWTSYFDAGAGTAQQAMAATAAALPAIKTVVMNTVTFTPNLAVVTLDSATGEATGASTVTQAPVVATGSGGQVPGQCQALVTYRTTAYRFGRNVKGHWNIPGTLLSLQQPAGTFGGTAAVQTGVDAMIAAANADLVVWSKPRDASGTLPARTGDIALVSTASVSTRYSTLRSRNDA